jgi:hypothetical protein
MRHPARRLHIDLPRPVSPDLAPRMPASITPEKLTEISTFLFGPAWKSPMARALNVSRITIARWASGESPIEGAAVAALWLLMGYHDLQTGWRPTPDAPETKPRRAERTTKPAPQAERYLLK